jgi:hypothetical protein
MSDRTYLRSVVICDYNNCQNVTTTIKDFVMNCSESTQEIVVAGLVADALCIGGLITQVEALRLNESSDFGRKIIEEAKKALQSDSSSVPSDPNDYLAK